MSEGEVDQELRSAVFRVFEAYDVDGSGGLEIEEVVVMVNDALAYMKQNRKVEQSEVEQFMSQIDKNNDGTVDKNELYQLFKFVIQP